MKVANIVIDLEGTYPRLSNDEIVDRLRRKMAYAGLRALLVTVEQLKDTDDEGNRCRKGFEEAGK